MRKLTLRQQVIFGLIFFGVSASVSFILAILGSGIPAEQHSVSPWLPGLLIGMVAALCYAVLSGNRAIPVTNDVEKNRALAALDERGTRLIVIREGFVGKLAGIDILVDGNVRAQLKSPRFAIMVVEPGRRTITARLQNGTSEPLSVDIADGETAAFSLELKLGNRMNWSREENLAALHEKLRAIPMIASNPAGYFGASRIGETP